MIIKNVIFITNRLYGMPIENSAYLGKAQRSPTLRSPGGGIKNNSFIK